MIYFIGRENNVLFLQYLHFCIFDESRNSKICDVTIDISAY